MELVVTPTFAEVLGRVPLQYAQQLEECLRYHPPGYQHTPQFKAIIGTGPDGQPIRKWDGYITLIKSQKYRLVFPAGLKHRALALAHEMSIPCVVREVDLPRLEATGHYIRWADEKPHPPPPESRLEGVELADGTVLYPDQVEALDAALTGQRGLLALAPNFGKTALAAAIFAAMPKERGLIIVNQRAILAQMTDDLERHLGFRVWPLAANAGVPSRAPVTVAMIQTLHRRRGRPEIRKLLEDTRVLIVDECDTISPKSWFPVLGACRAPFRIGMSGTVREAHSPLPMEAFFGPVLAEVKDIQLIESGRSARPTVLMPNAGSLVSERLGYGDSYLEEAVVRNEPRNQMFADAVVWAAQHGLRSLILFYRIEHGERIQKLLVQAGIRSTLLHGKTHPDEVKQAKEALESHWIDAVVASTIFNRGVNMPTVDMLVNAAAWKSKRATAQKAARGLRRKPEGTVNRVLILDPWDLGAPLLKRHSAARERLYRRRGFEVLRGDLRALLAKVEPAYTAQAPRG